MTGLTDFSNRRFCRDGCDGLFRVRFQGRDGCDGLFPQLFGAVTDVTGQTVYRPRACAHA